MKITHEQLLAELRQFNQPGEIARKYDLTRSAVHKRIKGNEELSEAYTDAVAETVDVAKGQLFRKVREGNLKACIYVLSTLGKHEGFSTRTEIEGNVTGQGSVVIFDPKKSAPTDEELQAIAPNAGVIVCLPDNGRDGMLSQ